MVYDLEKVDMITTSKENPTELCLGITDDIQWEHHIEEHLMLLQEKLNNYVTFILNDGYKATIDKVFSMFTIHIYFANVPNDEAKEFIGKYQDALADGNIPIKISYEIVEPKTE